MTQATHKTSVPTRLLLAALAFALLTLIAGSWTDGARAAKKPNRPETPNILFISTDDQSPRSVIPEAMPNLFGRLMPRATNFTDYIVTTPLCCPSRATILTGQYGHNNGVLRNFYPDLKQQQNVLPAWLQRAGYNTAHVGKFLNSYEANAGGPAAVAPGWDLWFTTLEKRRYYNWKASKNGIARYRESPHSWPVLGSGARPIRLCRPRTDPPSTDSRRKAAPWRRMASDRR